MNTFQDYRNYIQKKIKNIPDHIWILLFLLVLSFLLKYYYVFECSDYKNYIFSDMQGYWARAIQRFEGDYNPVGQTSIWAPVYHYYLAGVFNFLAYFNLMDKKLEIVLFLNVLYSTISVLFVYLIARQLLSVRLSLAIAALYSLTYPLVHINAYILSETICLPLFLGAVYLVLAFPDKNLLLIIAGIIFGYAVGIRPAIGLFGLSFAGYIFFTGGKNLRAFIRVACFSIVFFLVIVSIYVENYNVSEGRLRGLSAHGGVNFFLAQCRVGKITSTIDERKFVLEPPYFNKYIDRKKIEAVITEIPFYNQKYFYDRGLECIREAPLKTLLGNFSLFESLFFGPFFPGSGGIQSHAFFMNIFNTIIFFMTMSLGILILPLKNNLLQREKIILLSSLIFWLFVTSYFFMTGQRQILPGIFAIYILFFSLCSVINKYELTAIRYFLFLIWLYFVAQAISR